MIQESAERMTEQEAAPEARLWQAVIASTVQEWISGPLRLQREAENYLFNDNSDFAMVCESAGMNMDRLRSRLLKLRGQTGLRTGADSRPNDSHLN